MDFKITITPPDGEQMDFSEFNNSKAKQNTKEENEYEFSQIDEEIFQKEKPKEIYLKENGKINRYINASFKEMQNIIEEIHKIKLNGKQIKKQITQNDHGISSLVDKQKELQLKLIKSDSISEDIQKEIAKCESEIQKIRKHKSELNEQLKLLNEDDLFNAQIKQLEKLKEKKNTIELCISNFSLIKTHTEPLLKSLSTDKERIAKLKKELEEMKTKAKSSDEVKEKCKEVINKNLKVSLDAQENLLNECEHLRILLDEKMKQTMAVNKTISTANYYLELIDKYGEAYIEIDKKEKEYEEEEKQYKEKNKELNDIIEKIDKFSNKYTIICDNLNENITTMENFINIEIIQAEQIENYNSEIISLKNNINLMDEKIELLELENKALEAEISPCELKISKFESEKKFKVDKMKFAELGSVIQKINDLNIEKKKYMELIKKIQDEISNKEAENMKMINEIENKTKLAVDIESELRSEKIHYLKCYESVIEELPEALKSKIIQEEIKFVNEELDALNDEFGEENATNENKSKNKL